jgi:hypothetical protein
MVKIKKGLGFKPLFYKNEIISVELNNKDSLGELLNE